MRMIKRSDLNNDQLSGFRLHNSLPVFNMDVIKDVGMAVQCLN